MFGEVSSAFLELVWWFEQKTFVYFFIEGQTPSISLLAKRSMALNAVECYLFKPPY